MVQEPHRALTEAVRLDGDPPTVAFGAGGPYNQTTLLYLTGLHVILSAR